MARLGKHPKLPKIKGQAQTGSLSPYKHPVFSGSLADGRGLPTPPDDQSAVVPNAHVASDPSTTDDLVLMVESFFTGLILRRKFGHDDVRSALLKLLTKYPAAPDNTVPLLPKKAPELWAERDLNRRENAPQFIRRVYAQWLGRGLARKDFIDLDSDLYKALSVWLSRHKDDDIAKDLPAKSDMIDDLIDRLGVEYSLSDLRKLGYAIDSRLRRKSA